YRPGTPDCSSLLLVLGFEKLSALFNDEPKRKLVDPLLNTLREKLRDSIQEISGEITGIRTDIDASVQAGLNYAGCWHDLSLKRMQLDAEKLVLETVESSLELIQSDRWS